jgi:hypothetical protein
MAGTVQIVVSWIVTPCGLVGVFSQLHFPTVKRNILVLERSGFILTVPIVPEPVKSHFSLPLT